MERKKEYTISDCIKEDSNSSLRGKIVVLAPTNREGQLTFCLYGSGGGENANDKVLYLISLHTGAMVLKTRDDVIGILKPGLLPESAKLQLAKIRPVGALSLNSFEPKYSTEVFMPDWRHESGVRLCTFGEVIDYIGMQMPYQHRITVCDCNGVCILTLQEGEITFYTKVTWKSFQNTEPICFAAVERNSL